MVPTMESVRTHPVHLVYPVQNPEPFFPSAAVGQHWLAAAFPLEVPMSSVELDGPANGSQPARRVAVRQSRVAGSRR